MWCEVNRGYGNFLLCLFKLLLQPSFLKKFYSPNPDKKLKVVFDCLNSPTSIILRRLFKKEITEKRFTLINADLKKSPQFFNPLEKKAINNLQAAVRHFKADLGIIFDADADRHRRVY